MDGINNDREFEQFLKENADNHRLYPADSVWENIQANLHPKKRWPLTALLLLAFTAGSITWFGTGERSIDTVRNTDQVESLASIAKTSNSPESTTDIVELFTAIDEDKVVVETAPVTATKIESLLVNELINVNEPTNANEPTAAVNDAPPSIATTALAINEPTYPLSIESVINGYQRQKHSPKFRWQIHFTPTISYRSLKEDQKFIAQARMNLSAAPLAATTELNNVIKHRPDVGMQLGLLGTYPVGKKLDLIAGLQFNVSKYDIKAFNYPTEVATIALVNAWGGPTAVTTVTSFRSNGFMNKASWLRNYYYSISAPVGLEWRILGKKQNHWGFSSTIQPTYMVGNRSYIISMDYQNYAEVPYLINKWNLNVGLETYAKFSVGKTDFKVGPQFRYQLFSSFKKGYPVSEHLYDFGVKLGVMLGK
ncbi:MAG: hypothetical protein FJY19_06165 [Bacteroidetes bacterium]|nr:hypothetical protein [Bacteroidota bacterium]